MTVIAETTLSIAPADCVPTECQPIEEGMWDLKRHFGYSGLDDPKLGLDIEKVQHDVREWVSNQHDDLSKPLYESLTDRLLAYEAITNRLELLRAYVSCKNSENVHIPDAVSPAYNEIDEAIISKDNFLQQTIVAGMHDSQWPMVSEKLYKDGWRLAMLFRPLRHLNEAERFRMAEIMLTTHRNAKRCHQERQLIRVELPGIGILNRDEANNRIFLIKDRKERMDIRRQLSEKEQPLGPMLCGLLLESVSCQDEEARLYGLMDAKALSFYRQDISESVYDALITVSRTYVRDYWERYNNSVSKLLDIPLYELELDDGPENVIPQRELSFTDSVAQIARAWGSIDPEFSAIIEQFAKENRICWNITHGRSSRQYSKAPVPAVGSFIAVRFDRGESCCRTLAHEFGHMIHAYFINAAKRRIGQGFEKSHVMSEVCSLFSESLNRRFVIDSIDDPKEKAARILSECSTWFNQIFGYINATEFEKVLHGFAPQEGVDIYDELSRLQRSNSLCWSNPVFYTNNFKPSWFLNYFFYEKQFCLWPYALSQMIVLSLYEMYEEAREAGAVGEFAGKLKIFMGAGGSKDPEDLLRDTFGIELGPELYEKGFRLIDKRLKEAATLLDKAEKSASS